LGLIDDFILEAVRNINLFLDLLAEHNNKLIANLMDKYRETLVSMGTSSEKNVLFSTN